MCVNELFVICRNDCVFYWLATPDLLTMQGFNEFEERSINKLLI